MIIFSLTGFAQSGQKWATGGNSISGGDFLGTTNNYPLLFKVNNNLVLSLKTNGDVLIHPFAGSDSGLVAYNSTGKLIPFKIPNNDKFVLLGNGTWGPLPIPNNYWKLDNTNNHLYTLTTGNVGIGTQTPVMKLDVNGDAIVRGYLYVDNGVIIGKRIESKSVDSDTLRVNEVVNTKELFSRQMYSDTLNTIKVETENMNASKAAAIGTTIVIDGSSSSIISAAGKIDFGSNELRTTGPITGGVFNVGTGNFGTLNVTNKINIGGNTLILENDPNGFRNSIYTHGTAQNEDLFIQSTSLNNNNTIINYSNSGNVGIGTNNPIKKLHVTEISSDGPIDPPVEKGGSIRLEHIYTGGTNSVWDIEPVALSSPNQIPKFSIGTPGSPKFTIVANGRVGIGTTNPTEMLDIMTLHDPVWIKLKNSYGSITLGFNGAHGSINSSDQLLLNWYTGKDVVVGGGGSQWNLPATGNLISKYNAYFATDGGNVGIGTNIPEEKLQVNGNSIVSGKVCIATNFNNINSDFSGTEYKLYVDGNILCKKVKVVNDLIAGADFVFEKDYRLLSLTEVENYINVHKHLPDIPSAADMKQNGIDLSEMNVLLLQKVEELTLYLIEQNKKIDALNNRISELESK